MESWLFYAHCAISFLCALRYLKLVSVTGVSSLLCADSASITTDHGLIVYWLTKPPVWRMRRNTRREA